MSQTSYPLSRTAKNIIFSATIPGATVALAMAVFGPWQVLDAAAPAVGDDPLTNHQIIRAAPFAQAHRGLNQADTNAGLIAKNWSFTTTPPPPSTTGFP